MAERIRAFDWSATPLGAPITWPASLRTTVAMMLRTRHPVFIFWGPALVCLYNDAYSASLGPEKHPGILGRPGLEAFPELWHHIGPDIDQVMSGGPATWHENKLVPSYRHGKLDDVWWTYSYGGIDDEESPNGVGGVLVLCNETTEQVRESQRMKYDIARMAELFEKAPLFMAALGGPEHRYEFVNPAYRQLIGGRDVIGQSVAEALPEVVEQGFTRVLDGVYASGQPYRALAARVMLAVGPEGELEERRLDFVYQPTLDAAGQVNGILTLGVDVTERVDAEESLELREEQLRLATEAGEVGFWDVDPVAGTLYWPQRVRQMFGVHSDREVFVERDFHDGLHPLDRAATLEAFARTIDPATRARYDVEYRTVGLDDGILRWVAAKGAALFDDSGRCVRVVGTAVDITARKRNEERLRELNETLERRLDDFLAERKLFADIVEGTDALIQVVDNDFNILAGNRGNVIEFENIYGVAPRVGDNLLGLLDHLPQAREEARRVWSRALAGETFAVEAEFGDAGHARRWYELHFQPLYASDGRRIGAYQFGFDVSARRAAEARLAEAEAALHQARRMESLGLVTGGVAHDFNNVLQALNVKFELIRMRAEDAASVRSWAASGSELTKKGARVTAQLLAFSRRPTAIHHPIRMPPFLENIRDLLRTTLGPEVALTLKSEDVWVRADTSQLEMALLNLVVNARDAMPDGGTVAVSVRAAAHEVEIAVADTGVGMTPELIAKAFTPFFTTKAFGKGSGLGLAQVYGMADREGGRVRIESDGRSGSTVVISLPRAEPEVAAPVVGAAGPSAPHRSARLLVVDDDAEVRGPLVEVLRGFGHQVVEAASGEQALAVLDVADAQILLCDFAMPGMNGVALANLARAAHPRLQVIFMSGYADADELRDAIGQSGLLLRKPFELKAVQRAIEQALRRHGG